ncbi:MAG TPA: FUSC family protein [Gammaproteobacteria bacterium]|nr:FUSC family protein [Gammaproteobacteria bacterium]
MAWKPSNIFKKPRRMALIIALEGVLITLLAYLLGSRFTAIFHGASAQVGGVWSVISGLVVLQSTIRETIKSSLLRTIGTFIGALICAVYLSLFGFSLVGMALCAGLTLAVCYLLDIFEYARLAAATVVIIAALSQTSPGVSPFLNAFLRFSESTIGVGVCILSVYSMRMFVRRNAPT